jgi:hypothetical protein
MKPPSWKAAVKLEDLLLADGIAIKKVGRSASTWSSMWMKWSRWKKTRSPTPSSCFGDGKIVAEGAGAVPSQPF